MSENIHSRISDITNMLMDDYTNGRVIDEIKNFDYPDKKIIIDILEKLKIVIYPGYYRNSSYRTYTVRSNISILLEDIIYNLIKQVSIVLKYAPAYREADSAAINEASERITFAFLEKIPMIREYIEPAPAARRRVGYGREVSQVDKCFVQNYNAAKAAGLDEK